MNADKSKLAAAFPFMLPMIIFMIIFVLIPIAGTIFNSFFQDVTFLPRRIIFLQNYLHLFSDRDFWQAMRFTLLFVIVSVPLELFLGLGFALILQQKVPGKTFLKTCLILPWVIPSAISARVWQLIFNFDFGLANWLMQNIVQSGPVNWLGSGFQAFLTIVLADAWKTTPFVAIILMAGLSNIPGDYYEAAKIDGASSWQRVWQITLPLLKPIMIISLLFRTIDALRIFDLIFVLTNGGPGGATQSLSIFGFDYYLSGDFGYGSVVSVVLFLIAFVTALIYLKTGDFHNARK